MSTHQSIYIARNFFPWNNCWS